MKAILEFNLPEEQIEFNRATQSLDMACALFDILQLNYKLGNADLPQDFIDGLESMAEGIVDILEQYNINIVKLVE